MTMRTNCILLLVILLGAFPLNRVHADESGSIILYTPYTKISVTPGASIDYSIDLINDTPASGGIGHQRIQLLVGRLVFQSGIEGKGGLGIALHIGLVGSELGLVSSFLGHDHLQRQFGFSGKYCEMITSFIYF